MISDVLTRAIQGMNEFLDSDSLPGAAYRDNGRAELMTLRDDMAAAHARITSGKPAHKLEGKINRWHGPDERLRYENGHWCVINRQEKPVEFIDDLDEHARKYNIS